MTDERPAVSPQLVAASIEAAPERVRRRLDRSPDAASDWQWKRTTSGWSVAAGEEIVELLSAFLTSMEQLRCTCLLAPNCFHVLACVTSLPVGVEAADESAIMASDVDVDSAEVGEESSTAEVEEGVSLSDEQMSAAVEFQIALAQVIRIGVANSGVVVQSTLLRAVHQARSTGLYRVATIGLRIIAGIRLFRARSVESDPTQIGDDVADALETLRRIISCERAPIFWIGTARRRQLPIRPRKLHGLFAEPILTQSGFAGAAAYFLGEDGQIYTASDVRPGDAQLAKDAYRGGIEIGSIIQPAKQLARGLYLGTDLTASHDGRLGRGKGIKIVEQGESSWQFDGLQKRFSEPLEQQWKSVYDRAMLPADGRPAGWDFLFATGTVIGACGAELLLQVESAYLRLAIENESESLCFRENLRLLSHAPGLQLQVIGRLDLADPTMITPLVVVGAPPENAPHENVDAPRLELPDSWVGRVFLGFDGLERQHLVHAQAVPAIVPFPTGAFSAGTDLLAPLRRRAIARIIAGSDAARSSQSSTIAAEVASLRRAGLATGAGLLDSFTRLSSAAVNPVESCIAASLYIRRCGFELARSNAMAK